MIAGSATVFWILGPLLVALGLYLAWYSHRRRRMLEAFARARGFSIHPEREPALQATLDRCFALQGEGLVRSFGQLSTVVEADGVVLFRAIELLDLARYGQSSSTHFHRLIALFDVPPVADEFFLLERSGAVRSRRPGSGPDSAIVEQIRSAATSCNARHSLSVTFARGQGLLYFEPLVVGGETVADLEALYCIARCVGH